jgi:tetratricopeptide (TPR) repeat protein
MLKERFRSDYGEQFHRKQAVHTAVLAVLFFILLAFLIFLFINWRNRLGGERKELLRFWDTGSYDKAFSLSREALLAKPLDYFLLTLHGFSAYQLAVAQINNFNTLTYIDECIWSLRKALLTKEGAGDGRVNYVLGKAYYYKGTGYGDLAVKYLEKARQLSYSARDIPEYLGLAYAAIHDYRGSVASFTLALNPAGDGTGEFFSENSNFGNITAPPYQGPADALLLAIARSYIALEEAESAKAYLVRCIENSRDSDTVITARLLLGDILGKEGDPVGEETQYMAIINEIGENAEAYYQLGELHAEGGDLIRARAEWRRAVGIDPAHRQARIRLKL